MKIAQSPSDRSAKNSAGARPRSADANGYGNDHGFWRANWSEWSRRVPTADIKRASNDGETGPSHRVSESGTPQQSGCLWIALTGTTNENNPAI
jgi:hypothetical protein